MARSKERRINTYFGRTVEENELWEFLLTNHPDDMAAYLKYYARLGMLQELNNTSKPLAKRSRKKNQEAIPKTPISPEKVKSPQILKEDEVPPVSEVEPLDDIELIIQDGDPSKKIELGFSRFIPEEDDEEILELLKNQIPIDNQENDTNEKV